MCEESRKSWKSNYEKGGNKQKETKTHDRQWKAKIHFSL